MKKQIIYIAIYRALECLEDETKNIELGEFLDKANPYVFKDRKSADPSIYMEYEKWVNENFQNNLKNETYQIARKYISEKTSFIDLFEDISEEEWNDLVKIIEKEETHLS